MLWARHSPMQDLGGFQNTPRQWVLGRSRPSWNITQPCTQHVIYRSCLLYSLKPGCSTRLHLEIPVAANTQMDSREMHTTWVYSGHDNTVTIDLMLNTANSPNSPNSKKPNHWHISSVDVVTSKKSFILSSAHHISKYRKGTDNSSLKT